LLTVEQKERLIAYRAEGLSYYKISKIMNVSKPTLLSHANELRKEIGNAQFLRYQAILEKYRLTKEAKITFLCQEIDKLKKVAEKRNYKQMSSVDLFNLLKNYEKELAGELKGVEFNTGEKITLDMQLLEKEKTIKLEE